MSRQVEIPGGTAQLRELDEITERQRRIVTVPYRLVSHIFARIGEEKLKELAGKTGDEAVEAQQKLLFLMNTVEVDKHEALLMMGFQDAAIFAFLESWSLPDPLPKSEEDVQGSMKFRVYDALAQATAADAAALSRGLDTSPTPGGVDSPFDKSATSSSPSNAPTAKKRSEPSSQKSGSDGESANSEVSIPA